MSGWTLAMAVDVCTQIEAICPQYGCHVGLTGGVLYKIGERKDLDVIFYKIRQEPTIRMIPLLPALYHEMGMRTKKNAYWCQKLEFAETWPYEGLKVDAFFPELFENGKYPNEVDNVK